MDYAVGVGLALGLVTFAILVGFDKERTFYPTVLIIVASYYVLFALGSGPAVKREMLTFGLFVAVSVIGFKQNLWWVVVALLGHALLDGLQGRVIFSPGVPSWWPPFCSAFDVTAAICLAARLSHHSVQSMPARSNQYQTRPRIGLSPISQIHVVK